MAFLNFKGEEIKVFLSLLIILFLPNIFFVFFKTSSLAPGFLIASVIVSLLSCKKEIFTKIKRLHLLILMLLILFMTIGPLFTYMETGQEKTLSPIFLIIALFSAYAFSFSISSCDSGLGNVIFKVILVLFLLGWLGFFKVTTIGPYMLLEKPIPPFSESSHYALAVGLFSTAYCFISTVNKSIFIIINILLLAFLLPSLTLLVFLVLSVAALSTKLCKRDFLILFIFGPISLLYVINIVTSKIDYFSSRLAASGTENLTTLVWIQGWQLAYKNILETKGWGLGLQALGLNESQLTEASHIIKLLSNRYLNFEDGGFLASKIISELGVVGIIISVFYLYKALAFPVSAGLSNGCRISKDESMMLLKGIVFAFVVEFLFRGYGYFSPGLYMLISSCFAISISKPKRCYNRARS